VRKRISVGVVFAVAALAMALTGSTSAAGTKPAKATSHGGWHVVTQHGKRNYAGPNCPGKGWNCTTSTRVLQAAPSGGQNVAECTGSTVMNPCMITQNTGGSNTARCTQKSTALSIGESCKITQSGTSNIAYVTQTISQADGSTQYGTQAAEVTQTGSVLNQLQLIQDASQSIKTGSTQTQNLYQSAAVSQTATGSASNTSSIYQSQLQKENAKSTMQKQNDGSGTGLGDCFSPDTPTKPNACANVTQVAENGNNDNHLKQFLSADENSTGPAQQVQGANEGGIDARVHQEVDGATAHSTNEVNQSKALQQTVPKGSVSSQIQIDPVRCCGTFSQLGGTGNTETINQVSALKASLPGASQKSSIIGESRSPDGSCTISQKASINGDSDTNGGTHSPCPLFIVQTSCNVDGCTAETPVFGEVSSSLDKTVRNDTQLEETFADSTTATTDDTVEFKITYTNNGTVDAHSVTVTDPLPATMAYGEECSPAPCSFTGGAVTWDIGTVAPDESVDVFFLADTSEASSGSTITNTASVLTKEEGPGAASDSATVTVPANSPSSSLLLGVRPTGSTEPFGPSTGIFSSEDVDFQITYSNSGSGDANNVTVTDQLVPGLTYVGGSCAGAPCAFDGDTNTITWTLGTRAPDNDLNLTFRATGTVSCSGSGLYSNTANGDSDEETPFSSNSAEVSVDIVC
jgi:uncharacterized repeat protein (TIGR01451 family)